MKEYCFRLYNFSPGPRSDAAHGDLAAMVADGWQINTCYPNYTECAVMWEREIRKAKS